MSDFIKTISHPTQEPLGHFTAFFPFLRQAFNPEPSSNQNIDRFDTIIAETELHFTDVTLLLDLGCGDSLLLQKVLKIHSDSTAHFDGSCSYIGVDLRREPDTWENIKDNRCQDCFPTIEYYPLDFSNVTLLVNALSSTQHDSFDRIYLMNVLHELPPKSWMKLFDFILKRLKKGGRLIIIDPDHDWCFKDESWRSGDKGLDKIPSEWEAEAVWLSQEALTSILKALNFSVTPHPYDRSRMSLWKLIASSQDESTEKAPDAGLTELRTQIEKQITAERKRIRDLRKSLRKQINHESLSSSRNLGTIELLEKTMQYFAACSSQCLRYEVMESLK